MKDRLIAGDVHMPPSWPPEKREKFLAWLNDELDADAERDLLRLKRRRRARAQESHQ